MVNTRISTVSRAIAEARRTLITSHVRPDGDAVGSTLAFGLALRAAHKSALMYLDDEIPNFLRFLPGWRLTTNKLNGDDSFDLAIVLDCSDLERVGGMAERIGGIPTVINIDHHRSNTGFGAMNLVEADDSATAQIVYRILKHMGLKIGAEEATNLYTGIMTDTGSFCYGNVNHDLLMMAADLVRAGADPQAIASRIYGQNHVGRLKLLRRALGSLDLRSDGRVGFISVSQRDFHETGSSQEDVRGFIDFIINIPGVEAAVLLIESNKNTIEISVRTTGRIDAAYLATQFGGGGHQRAAGFVFEGNVESAKLRLLEGLGGGLDGKIKAYG